MHYTEDPLMEGPRRKHRLVLEAVGTTTSLFGAEKKLYAAGCEAGDWMDPRQYTGAAHHEGFDQHMAEVQQKVHRETEAAAAEQDDRPDQEA
ncbi:hypothetical protein C6N75_00610 [Streptomyces solincola]|uniref:Uncharacterized protein n=1 Tax=Streptomyces solincola TaxID=2100817 RepID=A0A2S9Q327_9ACTN|nr:hypothetical protein [Streptomyces solincola]PRH81080.1 hypothetical protein C6N75_00610 [Streptomyces solincola]